MVNRFNSYLILLISTFSFLASCKGFSKIENDQSVDIPIQMDISDLGIDTIDTIDPIDSNDAIEDPDQTIIDQSVDSYLFIDGGCKNPTATVTQRFALADAHSLRLISAPATNNRVALVWEVIDEYEGSISFAITNPDGTSANERELVDTRKFAYSPDIAPLDANNTFGVIYISDNDTTKRSLVFKRINEYTEEKHQELWTNVPGSISWPTIAAGPQGIVIAVTQINNDIPKVIMAKIDGQGAMIKPFFSPTAVESYQINLISTATGFIAIWVENENDKRRVVVNELNSDLQILSTKIIFESNDYYLSPAINQFGPHYLVCAEESVTNEKSKIICRVILADGTLTTIIRKETKDIDLDRPMIAVGGNRFLLMYTSDDVANYQRAIHTQIISAYGEEIGTPIEYSSPYADFFYGDTIWRTSGFSIFTIEHQHGSAYRYVNGMFAACE